MRFHHSNKVIINYNLHVWMLTDGYGFFRGKGWYLCIVHHRGGTTEDTEFHGGLSGFCTTDYTD